MTRRILMCPPTFFDVREVKNPHMRLPIDRVRAQQQWENLRHTLQEGGAEVEVIPPVNDLEDMVFAANQVFIGCSEKTGPFIVPSEMRYLSRQKEVPFYVEWFRERGYQIIALDLNGECLEGHGDLIWHPDQSKIWAGYGFRSTRGGIARFSDAMKDLGFPVIPLQLVDEHCYHLDTCFCPLSNESVMIYPGAFALESLERIRRDWPRVHELSRDEAVGFTLNGIVANGRYITPRVTPSLAGILALENLTPLIVDTSEFEKSGGSVFCMKAVLD
jgi:N-dimethylarginine dimethylaminohydrolase